MMEKHHAFFESDVYSIDVTSTPEYEIGGTLADKISLIPTDRLGGVEVVVTKIIQGKTDILILLTDELEEY